MSSQRGRGSVFEATKFLRDNFRNSEELVAFLHAYGVRKLTISAVEKWFLRGSVPGAWLPILLVLLELEHGVPTSLSKYTRFNYGT